jgi:hypothetical protein
MVEMYKLHGRLGNQMFVYAFCYAYAKEHGTDIYFQNPKYFEKYANEIKAIFGDLTWTGEAMNDYVSVHVRRGDYVSNSFYVDLTQTDYYQKAMAEFPDRRFLVFSDDIEWCKKFFFNLDIYNDQISYSEGKTELEDLNLMMRCNGHIIANSTFSWWGAWLGKGKVVAPLVKNWYADGYERTVCPKEWTRI